MPRIEPSRSVYRSPTECLLPGEKKTLVWAPQSLGDVVGRLEVLGETRGIMLEATYGQHSPSGGLITAEMYAQNMPTPVPFSIEPTIGLLLYITLHNESRKPCDLGFELFAPRVEQPSS